MPVSRPDHPRGKAIFRSPVTNQRRAPLRESSAGNRNPYPTPTSTSSSLSGRSLGGFPPAFSGSGHYYKTETSSDRTVISLSKSPKCVAELQGGPPDDVRAWVRHHLCYSPPSSPESNSSQPATPVTSLEQLVRQDGYEWTTDEIVDAVLAVFPGVRVIENGSPKVRSMRLLDGLGIDKSARGSHYPSSPPPSPRRSIDVAGSEAGSGPSEFSLMDFAEVVSQAEYSPVLSTIGLPATEDQQDPIDDTSRAAANLLMSVAEIAGVETLRRSARPIAKAASPAPKVPRATGKKAKTAFTPVVKAKAAPEPKSEKVCKPERPAVDIKKSVPGAIDGVGQAPKDLVYLEMIHLILTKYGPLRVRQVQDTFKLEWKYYETLVDKKVIKSLGNSIRHGISNNRTLFMLEHAESRPDLVAAERARGIIGGKGGFWSVYPGRDLQNHKQFAVPEEEAEEPMEPEEPIVPKKKRQSKGGNKKKGKQQGRGQEGQDQEQENRE